jgi:hypothetical protein
MHDVRRAIERRHHVTQRTCSILCAIFGVATVLQIPVATAQSLPPQVAACAGEDNDIARLACYDRQNPPTGERRRAAASASAAPSPQPASTPTEPRQVAAAGELKSPPATAPANTAAEFGLSDSQLRKAQTGTAEPDPRNDKIAARVSEVSERAHGELLLKLDNGQLWTQTERRAGILIEKGESVTISRGSLGAFFLTSASRVTTRVRRLE